MRRNLLFGVELIGFLSYKKSDYYQIRDCQWSGSVQEEKDVCSTNAGHDAR